MKVCLGLMKTTKFGITLYTMEIRRIRFVGEKQIIDSIVDYMVASESVVYYHLMDFYRDRLIGYFDGSDETHLVRDTTATPVEHATNAWIEAWKLANGC